MSIQRTSSELSHQTQTSCGDKVLVATLVAFAAIAIVVGALALLSQNRIWLQNFSFEISCTTSSLLIASGVALSILFIAAYMQQKTSQNDPEPQISFAEALEKSSKKEHFETKMNKIYGEVLTGEIPASEAEKLLEVLTLDDQEVLELSLESLSTWPFTHINSLLYRFSGMAHNSLLAPSDTDPLLLGHLAHVETRLDADYIEQPYIGNRPLRGLVKEELWFFLSPKVIEKLVATHSFTCFLTQGYTWLVAKLIPTFADEVVIELAQERPLEYYFPLHALKPQQLSKIRFIGILGQDLAACFSNTLEGLARFHHLPPASAEGILAQWVTSDSPELHYLYSFVSDDQLGGISLNRYPAQFLELVIQGADKEDLGAIKRRVALISKREIYRIFLKQSYKLEPAYQLLFNNLTKEQVHADTWTSQMCGDLILKEGRFGTPGQLPEIRDNFRQLPLALQRQVALKASEYVKKQVRAADSDFATQLGI